MTACPICSATLPPSEARGRPAKYCSPACRRWAERELKRVEGRIAGLEQRLSDSHCSHIKMFDAEPELLEAELIVQRERLLVLLAADPEGEDGR